MLIILKNFYFLNIFLSILNELITSFFIGPFKNHPQSTLKKWIKNLHNIPLKVLHIKIRLKWKK